MKIYDNIFLFGFRLTEFESQEYQVQFKQQVEKKNIKIPPKFPLKLGVTKYPLFRDYRLRVKLKQIKES